MATQNSRPLPKTLTTAAISLTDTGDIVAAVSSMKIIVWELQFSVADSAKTVTLRDGTTAFTGAESVAGFAASALRPGRPIDDETFPLFETTAGNAFNLLASAAVQVSGHVKYTTAPA